MTTLTVTRPPAAAGLEWLKTGGRVFMAGVLPWMGMSAAFFLGLYVIGLIPLLGPLAVQLLSPFLVAAYMAAARAAERGEPTGLIHIGAGFQRGRQALLVIGAAYLLVSLLVGWVITVMGGEAVEQIVALAANPQALDPEQAERVRAALDEALPAVLVGVALFTPLFMATWFAPALALFDDFPPGKAMFWSLWACLVNWRPLLVYVLLLSLLAMVAMIIPLGLGLLIFLPLAMISTYSAYRAQFVPREAG